MPRFLFAFLAACVVTSLVTAGAERAKQVTLQAENIRGNETELVATGHIVLRYDDTLFLADHARYDKRRKRLVVSGAVQIVNADGSRVKTSKVTLETGQSKVLFEKFFYEAQDSDLWLSSASAVKKKACYQLKNAAFSSCAVTNPDWHLGFSEADYNASNSYITLKDIRFFIGNTPVFYFPYFAFSTAKERTSGLLIPYFGYSSQEGILYEQPLYWAINPSLDIEFSPQVRSNRGAGIYSTIRFADSAYSQGLFRLGYFVDKSAYTLEHDLEHDAHYGIEGEYDRSTLVSEKFPGYHDGLYANILLFNDIDYLNLQKNRLAHHSDSHLKESRFNYLFYSDTNYFGLQAKYFLDAKKQDNENTLQELPSLKWHRYSDAFADDHFSFSVDGKLSNFTRREGAESRQFELRTPLGYHLSFLDGYLHLKLGEELYAYAGKFDAVSSGDDSYQTLMMTHSVGLYGDIVGMYGDVAHTIEWSLVYSKQDYLGDGLREYKTLDSAVKKDFLSRKPYDDKWLLSLNQYWHGNDDGLRAEQRLSQVYYPGEKEKWGDLRHELFLEYGNWELRNQFEYSFEKGSFSEVSNRLSYQNKKMYLELERFWRKDLDLNLLRTNEVAMNLRYQYSKTLKLFGNITYDLDQKYSKKWTTGLLYDKGCWSVELSYAHDTAPVLARNGEGYTENNTWTVKINLVPLGESEIRQQ